MSIMNRVLLSIILTVAHIPYWDSNRVWYMDQYLYLQSMVYGAIFVVHLVLRVVPGPPKYPS